MTILEFLSENFQFLMMKFSIYLTSHVFVMKRDGRTGERTTNAKP